MKLRFACIALVVGCTGTGWWLTGCGGDDSAASSDAGTDSTTDAGNTVDSSLADSSQGDAKTGSDSGSDAVASNPNLKIVVANDAGLQGAPGDAVPLQVIFLLPDGGTLAVPVAQVTWTTPETVVAQNPNNPGPNSVLPEAGAKPTAFFVSNEYTEQNPPGILFVADPGTSSDAGVTVTASVSDAGQVSAVVAISTAKITGDATRGGNLFQNVLGCATCHGKTAAGSVPMDGGEAGVVYTIGMEGDQYPYPAPGLNDTTTDAGPNLAADPAWSAALLGMAAQADMDNEGVALRAPMPDFFGVSSSDGGATLNAQDFADIYAWLLTQH
jgi:Cytochrome c